MNLNFQKLKQLLIILGITSMFLSCKNTTNSVSTSQNSPFLWGVATAAYQVEGAYQTDGKGESKWDFLTNKIGVTQFTTGEKQTGNVAINMYDRTQYLKDIQLMKDLGVNAYRFSLDWSRIIPDGTGAVNEKALAHYDQLIDDVKAAGLEPLVTLYHFDYPAVLMQKGGWGNPDMIKWYTNYASVVLNRYGKKVKKFITFNEPYIEFFLVETMMNPERSKELESVRYAKQMHKAHNQFLANAAVIKLYHTLNLGGQIGMTLNVEPTAAWNVKDERDIKAAKFQDLLLNQLFIDALFKGSYPQEALDSFRKYDPTFNPPASDMALLASVKPDFLGINYYSPAMVKHEDSHMSIKCLGNNPDSIKGSMGPVRPEYLYQILMRLKNDYGNPITIITENGTNYPPEDVKVGNTIKDSMRISYIKRHIEKALEAKKDGANLQGYTVWSGWDNFEWNSGFTKRFGLIYVDYKTQERTPKQSYYWYQAFLKSQK